MKPLSEMTPEEIIRERDRRQALRDQGRPLTEDAELTRYSPLVSTAGVQILEPRSLANDLTLEKEVQRDVVKVYKAFHCKVYNLSQARASKQSPGLPDLWIHHRVVSWWHESKRPGGVQSEKQRDFQAECKLSGIHYVLGGVRAAEDWLIELAIAQRAPDGTLEPFRP